jgi:predicted  nucleic acid-binding Zn-ribbon protein
MLPIRSQLKIKIEWFNFLLPGITLKMSINRPDGAFTVEFLLKENAKLKESLDNSNKIWVGLDKKNDRLALMVSKAEMEIWDLKKQLADAHAVWESSERALVDRIKGKDLEIKDLIKEIFTLEEQKAELWKELVNMGGADHFTAAEYFAGR